MTGPLAGLRVVELGSDIAGPYCTKLLGDLGADVYKIEPPSGDPLRSWGTKVDWAPTSGHSGLFEYLNAGKRGATIDPEKQDAVAPVRDLIAGADLLVESLSPGALDRPPWRLDHDSLLLLNPGLVVVRISDYGQAGPRRDRVTTPLTLQAASGWVSMREPNRPPVQAGVRIPEFIVGAYAAMGALTALGIAAAAKQVVEVDVSAHESLLSALPYPMLMAERLKNLGLPTNSRAAPMLGIVRASDGWIGINCLTGQHWLDVCAMMGLPEFGERQLAIMLGGPDRDEFLAKAQPWLDDMSVAELVDLSQAMRIPAAPVTDGESILSCPQYANRGFFLKGRAAGRFIRPGPPFRLSRTPASAPLPAPRLGTVADGWTGGRPGAGDGCDDVNSALCGPESLRSQHFLGRCVSDVLPGRVRRRGDQGRIDPTR